MPYKSAPAKEDGTVKCPNCGGTRKVLDPHVGHLVPCPTCNGWGLVYPSKKDGGTPRPFGPPTP